MESNVWDPLGWKEVFSKLNLEAPPVCSAPNDAS